MILINNFFLNNLFQTIILTDSRNVCRTLFDKIHTLLKLLLIIMLTIERSFNQFSIQKDCFSQVLVQLFTICMNL